MTTTIPFYDFGGDGPLLHFAHPNAYTPRTFRRFIEPFLPHYHVVSMWQRPLWPNADPNQLTDWHLFGDDLIQFMAQQGYQGIIGMGHSLGAVATMFASLKRPALFRRLILIDPVFLHPNILKMSAANPEATQHLPLVKQAARRRHQWESRSQAFAYFRDKKVFAAWPDDVLEDFVQYAMHTTDTGQVQLTFPPVWEARIYATPPVTVWEDLPHITHPTLAIHGQTSDTLNPVCWQLWQEKQPNATFIEIDNAGHMVVAERPLQLAQAILDYLQVPEN